MAQAADAPVVLRVAGRPAGRHVTRPELPARLSPRPHLHPVTTPAGTQVTEPAPAGHLHHLGVGAAVPGAEGPNFSGGPAYVRDRGPTGLDNHGVLCHHSFQPRDPDGFVAELRRAASGAEPLRERLTVAATELTGTARALDFTLSLTDVTGAPLSLGSPATDGRPGAAYGGFFRRARKEDTAPDVFAAHTGEERVHGGRADRPASSGTGRTLVLEGATDATRRAPWCARTAEYPGVGSSPASAARLPIASGDTVVRRIVTVVRRIGTVVADCRLSRDEAAAPAGKAVSQ